MRKENNNIAEAIRLLKKHYWANILFLVFFFLLVLSRWVPLFGHEQPVSVTLERYAIMLPIIAIPFSLKYFAHRIKKVPRPAATTTAIGIYKRASFLRLYTLSAVTLALITLFGYSGNMNFFWFTVVLLVVFLFCKPSRGELTEMTEKPVASNPETGAAGVQPLEAQHLEEEKWEKRVFETKIKEEKHLEEGMQEKAMFETVKNGEVAGE